MAFMRKDPKTATRMALAVLALALLSIFFLHPADPKASAIATISSGALFGIAFGMNIVAIRMRRNAGRNC